MLWNVENDVYWTLYHNVIVSPPSSQCWPSQSQSQIHCIFLVSRAGLLLHGAMHVVISAQTSLQTSLNVVVACVSSVLCVFQVCDSSGLYRWPQQLLADNVPHGRRVSQGVNIVAISSSVNLVAFGTCLYSKVIPLEEILDGVTLYTSFSLNGLW